jgi:hypothetical protein
MDFGPEYEHIPRDAEGIPVFFILPPEVRANYDRKMSTCEAGWAATQDPLFAAEAITLTKNFRQVVPAWLDDGVYAVALKRRTPQQVKRARDAADRLARYLAVRDAHKIDGMTWERAKEHAANMLGVEPDTCWESYKKVRRDLKDGRGGLYAQPKVRRVG